MTGVFWGIECFCVKGCRIRDLPCLGICGTLIELRVFSRGFFHSGLDGKAKSPYRAELVEGVWLPEGFGGKL